MSADFQPGMEPTGNRPLSYNVRCRLCILKADTNQKKRVIYLI